MFYIFSYQGKSRGTSASFAHLIFTLIFKPHHIRKWSFTHAVDMVMKTTIAYKHLRVCYKGKVIPLQARCGPEGG